ARRSAEFPELPEGGHPGLAGGRDGEFPARRRVHGVDRAARPPGTSGSGAGTERRRPDPDGAVRRVDQPDPGFLQPLADPAPRRVARALPPLAAWPSRPVPRAEPVWHPDLAVNSPVRALGA